MYSPDLRLTKLPARSTYRQHDVVHFCLQLLVCETGALLDCLDQLVQEGVSLFGP